MYTVYFIAAVAIYAIAILATILTLRKEHSGMLTYFASQIRYDISNIIKIQHSNSLILYYSNKYTIILRIL